MTQQFGSELTGEKQNEMMPPPEVPELGSFSALPPPVAANGASTSTSSGYEQRPDSGIDLDNGVPNVRSYETNGALSEERALYDKLTVGRG